MFGRKQNDDLSTKNDDFTNDMKIVNAVIECYRYDRNHPQYLADCIQKTGIVELLNKHIGYLEEYYDNNKKLKKELVHKNSDELRQRIGNIIALYNTPSNTNNQTYFPGINGSYSLSSSLTGMKLLNELLVFTKTQNNGNYQNPEDKATLTNFVKSMFIPKKKDLNNKPTSLTDLVKEIYKKKEDLKNKAMEINNYLNTSQTTTDTPDTAPAAVTADTSPPAVPASTETDTADTSIPADTASASTETDPADLVPASNNTTELQTPGGKRNSRRKKNNSRKSNNKKGGKSKSKKNHKKTYKRH